MGRSKNLAAIDHLRHVALGVFDDRRLRFHVDHRSLRPDGQRDLQIHVLADQHGDVFLFEGLKTGSLYRNAVTRRRNQRRCVENSFGVALQRTLNAFGVVRHYDIGARDHRS